MVGKRLFVDKGESPNDNNYIYYSYDSSYIFDNL